MNKDRLAMYVICCHVDKFLEEDIPSSEYDIFIQAGAALTDKRVCALNDYDNLEDNISERNERYSEMTAMYWIGKNISSEYVGITHYRRRFLVSDVMLSDFLDDNPEILSTYMCPTEGNIRDNYINSYYGYDWQLFMDIVDEFIPEDRELIDEQFSLEVLHPCNMGIFRADVYKEYCEWIFPLLDAFYKRSIRKTDRYQRRDVGFIGERLTSIFIEKKKRQGANIIEIPHKEFKSNNWQPEDECDVADFKAVMESCRKYYALDDISKCRRLVAAALNKGGIDNDDMRDLAMLFKTALDEQKTLRETMFEYLPEQWKKDMDTLLSAFRALSNIMITIDNTDNSEAKAMLTQFVQATGFSREAINSRCVSLGIKNKEKIMELL